MEKGRGQKTGLVGRSLKGQKLQVALIPWL